MKKLPVESGNNLSELSDDQLVRMAKKNDNAAIEVLVDRYKNCISLKTRTYFLRGADKEDIMQEGMIGLIKAIRDYKEDRQVSFKSFAELCITRQIITAVKAATRQKHIPLNSYVSLYGNSDSDEDRAPLDLIDSNTRFNPEEYIIMRENMKKIDEQILKLLSKFEKNVLECYLTGKSYQEISTLLDRPVKSIDNALQRIKRKLEKCSVDEK
ncbi:MAG: RNA polymerase sporulation sigma factor SigH [Clostridia bacterium]|nr:RNA polymerase sporulation sigma factor SigH [Clostridia bacterium]